MYIISRDRSQVKTYFQLRHQNFDHYALKDKKNRNR